MSVIWIILWQINLLTISRRWLFRTLFVLALFFVRTAALFFIKNSWKVIINFDMLLLWNAFLLIFLLINLIIINLFWCLIFLRSWYLLIPFFAICNGWCGNRSIWLYLFRRQLYGTRFLVEYFRATYLLLRHFRFILRLILIVILLVTISILLHWITGSSIIVIINTSRWSIILITPLLCWLISEFICNEIGTNPWHNSRKNATFLHRTLFINQIF